MSGRKASTTIAAAATHGRRGDGCVRRVRMRCGCPERGRRDIADTNSVGDIGDKKVRAGAEISEAPRRVVVDAAGEGDLEQGTWLRSGQENNLNADKRRLLVGQDGILRRVGNPPLFW